MSDPRLPPMDDDVLEIVQRGARLDVVPVAAKARVLAKVEARLGAHGGGGGDRGSGPPDKGLAGSVAPRVGLLRKGLPLAASFTLGGAVGAIAMRMAVSVPTLPIEQRPPALSVQPFAARAFVGEPPAMERPSTSNLQVMAPPDEPTGARALPSSPASTNAPRAVRVAAGSADELERERVLLDRARGALEREDPLATLAATAQHERQYPNGILGQEREAMAVRALLILGRVEEARVRVRRFRERFPDSVLLPALASAVGGRRSNDKSMGPGPSTP